MISFLQVPRTFPMAASTRCKKDWLEQRARTRVRRRIGIVPDLDTRSNRDAKRRVSHTDPVHDRAGAHQGHLLGVALPRCPLHLVFAHLKCAKRHFIGNLPLPHVHREGKTELPVFGTVELEKRCLEFNLLQCCIEKNTRHDRGMGRLLARFEDLPDGTGLDQPPLSREIPEPLKSFHGRLLWFCPFPRIFANGLHRKEFAPPELVGTEDILSKYLVPDLCDT